MPGNGKFISDAEKQLKSFITFTVIRVKLYGFYLFLIPKF